jgi:poly(A) polymerase
LCAVSELEKLFEDAQKNDDLCAYLNEEVGGGHRRRAVIKMACVLHDIGKPDTRKDEPDGRLSFHGHERVGRDIVRLIVKSMMMSTKERYAIEDMVMLHLRPGYLSNFKKPSDRMIFRFMRDAGEEAVSVLLLSVADQHATRGPLTTEEDIRHHKTIAFDLIDRFFAAKKEKPFVSLINGHDLIKDLKLTPGPDFAKILTSVEEAQHLGQVTTKAEALALALKVAGQ